MGNIYIDIMGAYDNVNIDKLIEDLGELKVPGELMALLRNMMGCRKLIFVHLGQEICTETSKGLPQGSILSPLLFNIYMRKIKLHIHKWAMVKSFADDFAVHATLQDMELLEKILNESLEKLDKWLRKRNLRISSDKTKVMLFLNSEKELNIHLNGEPIQQVGTYKFLRVAINDKLKWDCNVEMIKRKAKDYNHTLKAVTGWNWGASPDVTLVIYKGLIRATLDWGSLFHQDTSKKNWLKIKRVQYAALRSVTWCIKTIPINILLHLSGEPDLVSRERFLTRKYLARQISKNNNQLIPILRRMELRENRRKDNTGKSFLSTIYKIWKKEQEKFQHTTRYNIPRSETVDYWSRFTTPTIDLETGCEVLKHVDVSDKWNKLMAEKYKKSVLMYNDGSKSSEGVGAAALRPSLDQ